MSILSAIAIEQEKGNGNARHTPPLRVYLPECIVKPNAQRALRVAHEARNEARVRRSGDVLDIPCPLRPGEVVRDDAPVCCTREERPRGRERTCGDALLWALQKRALRS